MAFIMAADVGGTKTNIGIFDNEQGYGNPIVDETLLCKNYSNVNQLLEDFSGGKEYPIECACFAAAGPVRDGRVQLTNLPWSLDENNLKDFLGIRSVHVINDLVALAYSIPELTEKDRVTLHAGSPEKYGAIGIVAPGTGLGMAFLVWDGSKYIACPSEGGHAAFSPNSDIERAILQYYQEKNQFVSYEFLCSGKGIFHIYSALKKISGFDEPVWMKSLFEKAEDPAPVIVDIAMKGKQEVPICHETVAVFVEILAGVCRNLALTIMATGGIFLGGGILPRISAISEQLNFVEIFQQCHSPLEVVNSIPIHCITNTKATLSGAAAFCR